MFMCLVYNRNKARITKCNADDHNKRQKVQIRQMNELDNDQLTLVVLLLAILRCNLNLGIWHVRLEQKT